MDIALPAESLRKQWDGMMQYWWHHLGVSWQRCEQKIILKTEYKYNYYLWVVICILVWVFSFSRTGQFLNEVMKETWGQFEQWEGFRRWCDIDDATFAVITATFLSRDFSISSHYQGSIDFNTEEGSISWYLQGWYWMTWSSEIILSNTLPRERIGKYCHRQ